MIYEDFAATAAMAVGQFESKKPGFFGKAGLLKRKMTRDRRYQLVVKIAPSQYTYWLMGAL